MKTKILAIASLMNAMSIFSAGAFAQIQTERCDRGRNGFVFNKANINAIVSLACSSLTHIENERRSMRYEDSATMFHQWSTIGDNQLIEVQGHCAIPLPSLKDGKIDRHVVNLKFKKLSMPDGKKAIEVTGSLVGKSMRISFSNNEFLDPICSRGAVAVSQLESIALGPSLFDMLKSLRSGTTLRLLETESWIQGQASGNFSGLGVFYRIPQFSGRQLGIAMTAGDFGNTILARSANVLDYFAGGDYFRIEKDFGGSARGFINRSQPNNHKYESYPIVGGSQMIGCSALVFNGELDLSRDIDMYVCKRLIEQSALSNFTQERFSPPVAQTKTAHQIQIETSQIERKVLLQKVESYISRNFPPARFYSERPNIYEDDRTPWSKEDKQRGYVVMSRSFQIDTYAQNIVIVESRNDPQGNRYLKRITVKIAEL
jgi:hypothetical protein